MTWKTYETPLKVCNALEHACHTRGGLLFALLVVTVFWVLNRWCIAFGAWSCGWNRDSHACTAGALQKSCIFGQGTAICAFLIVCWKSHYLEESENYYNEKAHLIKAIMQTMYHLQKLVSLTWVVSISPYMDHSAKHLQRIWNWWHWKRLWLNQPSSLTLCSHSHRHTGGLIPSKPLNRRRACGQNSNKVNFAHVPAAVRHFTLEFYGMYTTTSANKLVRASLNVHLAQWDHLTQVYL